MLNKLETLTGAGSGGEIPEEFQREEKLPDGTTQILDNRNCYRLDDISGRYVESDAVAWIAESEGWTPPDEVV